MMALTGLLAGGVRADPAADLVRIHLEAIGGRTRVEAMRTLRATGRVLVGSRELTFEMIAARPNRVRVTTRGEGRTVVQGYDGVTAPWRWEPGAKARAMPAAEAQDFVADAAFDDPLVDPGARGIAIDFAGETLENGHRRLRVLVTQGDAPPSFLTLDGETYFILRKEVTRRLASGREAKFTTIYGDYRPVGGVALPHRIEAWADGVLLHRTELDRVEANAGLAPGAFAAPAGIKER